MNIVEKHVVTYLLGATAYGFARKVIEVADAKVETYDYESHKYKTVPMLFVDKAMIAGISILTASTLFPVLVYQDARQIEMRMRNADPVDYGDSAKKNLLDYIF